MAKFSTSLRDSNTDGVGSFASYVDSLDESKKGNLDPSNPKHEPLLKTVVQAIQSGELNEEQVRKLMRMNSSAAPVFASAYDAGRVARTRQQILSEHFQPAQTALPEQTGYVNLPQGAVEQTIAGRAASPGKDDVEGAIRAARQVGDFGLIEKLRSSTGGELPASPREFEYLKTQFPGKKFTYNDYLDMKRQGIEVAKIGGVTNLISKHTGEVVPLSTIQQEVSGAAAIEGGKKAAEVKAGAQAQSEVDLGSNLDDIQKMREGISGLLTEPGFDTVYGLTRPVALIPGTSAANAEARREQLEAQSFGISIQKMRGLGQLSEAEGKKVTAAYTRAINPKQSAKAARQAWAEVNRYLDVAEKRAYQKAGQAPAEQPPQPSGGFKVIGRRPQ